VPAYTQVRDRFEIVAVADISPARRAAAHAALPNARIYDDHASLLLAEHGNIDFVDIATPPGEHARIARAALARGHHVFCEKPVATSPEDMRAMIVDARNAKRVLFPSHNYKHAPVIRGVRSVLDKGTIGRVRLATLQTFRTTHAKGTAEWRPDWRREKKYSGGGIVMDHGPHTFYLAFDWLGAYPHAVTAKTWTLGEFDTEDNFTCAMTFPNGIATASLTWTAGERKVIYTIHGERGAIRVEDDDIEVVTLGQPGVAGSKGESTRERLSSSWKDASHAQWFESLFMQFARAIETDDFVGKEVLDAVRCTELTAAAYASAADGSREQVFSTTTVRASQTL
jgi:predicted dehydrogenase